MDRIKSVSASRDLVAPRMIQPAGRGCASDAIASGHANSWGAISDIPWKEVIAQIASMRAA